MNIKRLLSFATTSTILFSAAMFNGCQSLDKQHGIVVDSIVEGMEYQCSGEVHYTTKSGAVNCAHLPLGFKVGEIVIGRVWDMPSDGIILPQDLVGTSRSNLNSEDVKKLIVILQTLDADHNPENGITITKETSDKLKIYVDLHTYSMNEIKEIIDIQLGDQNYTNPTSAIEHLKRSMRKFNVPVGK